MERATVLKLGGSVLDNETILEELCSAIAKIALELPGLLVVHGGGKHISRNLKLMGEAPTVLDGLRVTDDKAMEMVEMTLSGQVNKTLVRKINKHAGVNTGFALGLSGIDGNILRCESIREELGRVGRVTEVNAEWLEKIWKSGGIPVLSPVSLGPGHLAYNVNADEAARAVAEATKAQRLIFLSDVKGVYDAEENVFAQLERKKIEELRGAGIISGGMIPKVDSCLSSVENGVSEVHICGWTDAVALLEQVTGKANHGTIIAGG